jgi:hypothetical protein
MKYVIGISTIILMVLFFTTLIMAQPGLPSVPDQTPIDGGLGLLAAVGGGYALKKLRDRKKLEQEDL